MPEENKKNNKQKEESSSAKATEDEVANLKKELEDAKAKCEEYLNGWKRERADFLNYKKDEMERIGQLVKYSNEELILKIIPILDNIYLAESHVPKEFEGNDWLAGFLQIKKQLSGFLSKEGIEPIKTTGEKFDPNTMEAVEGEGEIVSEELQRGYTLHGKIVRVAKVKISK
ncbi:MAG: nucleotide exchange factor GrpE [Candidatus Staskawiczbacteria bacterium]|jgi:molecular chaperone GrpE